MSVKHCGLVVVATTAISMLTAVVVAAGGTAFLKSAELALSIAVVAFLLRTNRRAVITFIAAAAAVSINQMLLAYAYLTFLNAGQIMFASSVGPLSASVVIGVAVASITTAAFDLGRVWAYIMVAVLLIAISWPTTLSGVSI